jgi:hypothetical protein
MVRWILFILSFFLLSCGAKRTVTGVERTERDSIIVREVLVPVEVPGATVVTPGVSLRELDSLFKAGMPPRLITERLIQQDPETGLKVGILIDRLGNLTAICEQQDRTISILQRQVEYYKSLIQHTTVEVSLTWYQQLWRDFKQLIVGAALVLAFSFIKKFTS